MHLRNGRIARGGIRWSDRREDFRTEVLGLVKAQIVKNAVIVPTGAKGGFVLKRAPASPEQLRTEGVACYRQFIAGLLDLTDNIVGGAIVPPPSTVRFDGGQEKAALLIPSEAVIRTGQRSVVMVDDGKAGFVPTEIQTGHEADGRIEVLQGLQAGQKVVTSGQFLIDSEASLKGIEARLGEEAGEIFLAGSMNGWNPANNDYLLKDEDGDGIYSIILQLAPGTYQYKFVIDGTWTKDPYAPMSTDDGFGGMNGKFSIP